MTTSILFLIDTAGAFEVLLTRFIPEVSLGGGICGSSLSIRPHSISRSSHTLGHSYAQGCDPPLPESSEAFRPTRSSPHLCSSRRPSRRRSWYASTVPDRPPLPDGGHRHGLALLCFFSISAETLWPADVWTSQPCSRITRWKEEAMRSPCPSNGQRTKVAVLATTILLLLVVGCSGQGAGGTSGSPQSLAARGGPASLPVVPDATYVGSETCKGCHEDQFKKIDGTLHGGRRVPSACLDCRR